MNTTILIGTELVQSAANRMMEAAHEMHRAASEISNALDQHKRAMEEFVVAMRDTMKMDKEEAGIYIWVGEKDKS